MIRVGRHAARASALAAAALALAIAAPSRADEPARRDPAAAEALWQEGRALRAAGKIKEACPKFEASYKLDPALGALLNLASCHELEGRIGTAWAEYRDAEEQAKRAGDKKRIDFARKRADALEARVPRLELRAPNPPEGLVVTRDGQQLAPGALGSFLPVDPGVHTLEARAPGRAPWKQRVDLRPGERQTIDVPPLARVAAPVAAPEPGPAPVVDGAPEAPPPSPPSNGARTAAYVLGGVGLAGLGVGIGFGVMTGSAASDAHHHCPNDVCTPAGQRDVDRAKTLAWVADGGFAVAAVGLVAAGVLFVTSRSRPSSAIVVAPTPGGAAAVARTTF